MKRVYIVTTEVTHERGVWREDETFNVIAPNAIAAALRVQRKQQKKWNNVRVRSVNYFGTIS